MEEIARNPGLQHIIEKSLTLLNIWDIASVKLVNQDFRKIVDCPRFYLMKLFQLSQRVNIPVDLIQKWQKLIPELNDEVVEEDLKLELFKMNCPPKNPTYPKYPLQLAYDLSDEKEKLELASFIIENSNQTDYVKAKEGLLGNLTPMHLAAMFGYEESVTTIINKNSNEPNPADVHGITPILLAAEYGHLNIVQLLMSLTENPNAPRNDGSSPIHCAATTGHLEVVRLLMNSTTNPNTRDIYGCTPIHFAAKYGHLEIVRLLMTATDANPNAQTLVGNTPSDLARQFGHLEIEQELKAFSIIKNIPQYNFLFYSTKNNNSK